MPKRKALHLFWLECLLPKIKLESRNLKLKLKDHRTIVLKGNIRQQRTANDRKWKLKRKLVFILYNLLGKRGSRDNQKLKLCFMDFAQTLLDRAVVAIFALVHSFIICDLIFRQNKFVYSFSSLYIFLCKYTAQNHCIVKVMVYVIVVVIERKGIKKSGYFS